MTLPWHLSAALWRARALAAEAALDLEYGGHVCLDGRPCHHEPDTSPRRSLAEMLDAMGRPDPVPGTSCEVVYGPGPASLVVVNAGGSR